MVRRDALLVVLMATACWRRAEIPAEPPEEAQVGRCRAGADRARLCSDWDEAVLRCGGRAGVHDSFPELVPRACFIPVRYRPGKLPSADPIPEGCGYPANLAVARRKLLAQAKRYERVADGAARDLPLALACELDDADRAVAARTNASTLRALAGRLEHGDRFAYGAASTFGFGHAGHDMSALLDWRPGDACIPLDKWQMDLLGINRNRAGRAAAAYHGGVAPIVTVSGGAVHSDLHEAFMLHYLASCVFDVPADAILLDPCADHTHTNMRNTGGLVRQLGARTAYVVTSSDMQGKYLQEWTIFSLVGGSIDQRALRDWGYLLGAWRQASVGMDAGFWFTPFRFWGEPITELGGAACVD